MANALQKSEGQVYLPSLKDIYFHWEMIRKNPNIIARN